MNIVTAAWPGLIYSAYVGIHLWKNVLCLMTALSLYKGRWAVLFEACQVWVLNKVNGALGKAVTMCRAWQNFRAKEWQQVWRRSPGGQVGYRRLEAGILVQSSVTAPVLHNGWAWAREHHLIHLPFLSEGCTLRRL